MTSVRRDLSGLLMVVAVTASMAAVFPYETLSWMAQDAALRSVSRDGAASAAFISLTPTQERAALKAAKTSWQVDASGVKRLRADLLMDDLPDDIASRSVDVGAMPSQGRPLLVGYAFPMDPRSAAAEAPRRLARDRADEARPLAFSREELLKLQ